jgi:hypothetical protein
VSLQDLFEVNDQRHREIKAHQECQYNKQFSLKVLKVDQSLVQDIESSQKTQALIKAVIGEGWKRSSSSISCGDNPVTKYRAIC